MADKLSVEEQIALILKKAESATPAEAEMLTERAAKLMQKYAIDEAMLNAARVSGQRENPTTKMIPVSGIYVKAWMQVAWSIGRHMNVKVLQSGTGKYTNVMVIGFPSDIALFETMFQSLQLQGMVAMRDWWNSNPDRRYFTGSEAYNERRTFLAAFGRGAGSIMQRTYNQAKTEAGSKNAGTELVLVNRSQEVEQYTNRLFPKLGTARGMRGGSYSASAAGFDAGTKANVGTNRSGVGAGRKAVGR